MSIRRSSGRTKSKSKKSNVLSRTSKATTYEQTMAKITVKHTLDQLRSADRIYQGTLGIRFKHYGVDKETGNIEMTFDASNIIIDGKQYKRKNWIIITYDQRSDTYMVQGMHMDKNYNRVETKLFTQLFSEDLYPRIFKLTQS